MKAHLVTRSSDATARLVALLASIGITLHLLQEGEEAPPRSVALYAATPGLDGWPNHHVRMPPFQMETPPPVWARSTPFAIAVRESSISSYLAFKQKEALGEKWKPEPRHLLTLPDSLKQVVDQYEAWVPGRTPATPWHIGGCRALSDETRSGLDAWLVWVERVYTPNLVDNVFARLSPICGDDRSLERALETGGGRCRVLVMACPSSNKAHTDSATQFVREKLVNAHEEFVALFDSIRPWVSGEIQFMVPGGDFVSHSVLKSCLHPFYWPAVAIIEERLGRTFTETDLRSDQNLGERSDQQVGASLEQAFNLANRKIVSRLSGTVACHWQDVVPWHYFDEALQLVRDEPELQLLVDRAYSEKVAKFASYQAIDRVMGGPVGRLRAAGNTGLYVGFALFLRDNPDVIVIDAEVDPEWWRRLDPYLSKIWGDHRPFIGAVTPRARQHWTY